MRKFYIVILLIVPGLALAAMILHGSDDHDPRYQGKSLDAWMKDLDDQHSGLAMEQSEHAIQQIGIDALPTVIRMIDKRNSSAKPFSISLLGHPFVFTHRETSVDIAHREALAACRILGPKARPVIPSLMKLLHDPEARELQFNIVGVLSWIGPESLPPLIQSLSTNDGSTKFMILFCLGSFRSNAAIVIPVLLKSLHAGPSNCRTQAAVSLGRIAQNEEMCVPALTNLLTDPDSQARWGACTALSEFKDRAKSAVPALLSALADSDPAVRGMAAIALMKIEPENIPRRQILMPILINNLEGVAGSKLDSLRFSTIQVIGLWGEQAKAAVPALLQCLAAKESYVRKSADIALKRIDPAATPESGIE